MMEIDNNTILNEKTKLVDQVEQDDVFRTTIGSSPNVETRNTNILEDIKEDMLLLLLPPMMNVYLCLST